MEFFATNLDEREYKELSVKGYLKLKIEIPVNKLKEFDQTFRSGADVTFHYNGMEVKTVITSIEISGASSAQNCKVFLGFAPK